VRRVSDGKTTHERPLVLPAVVAAGLGDHVRAWHPETHRDGAQSVAHHHRVTRHAVTRDATRRGDDHDD